MVQMAHLAAAPRFPLAVELWPDACAQPGRNRGDLVADEVLHHHRGEARRVAQRPAGNRPDVLLELIRYADCFGPVPGIMDSRGYLVDQQRLAGNEELDAEHADIIEGTGNAPCRGDRLCRRLGAYSRRDSAGVEDMAAVDVLRSAKQMFVLGRGYSFGVAQEAALKLKETCAIQAEPFSSAEVRHGPMRVIDKGFPVLAFATSDMAGADVASTAREFGQWGAVPLIAGQGGALSIVTGHPALEPIAMLASFYRLAEQLSLELGMNPDAPRGLAKVTKTR